nr:WG repeat-containing protein [Lachnospiraceae bacterium]
VIVQLQYDDFRAPNRKGYSVFINGSYDDITSCLYDNKGNLITSHNGYMVANSDVYVTTDSVNYGKDDPDKALWEDFYSTTHNYYSYDGSLLASVESGFSERHVAPPTGFYNGKAVVTGHIKTPVYKQADIHTGVHPYEFGFINTKGKTIWKDGDGFDDTDTALFMDYASGLAAQEAEQAKQQDYYYGGAGGADKMNEVHSVISTLNHGYFLTQGVWEDGIALRNESGEMVARLAPWYFGINSENELIYSSMQYMPYDDERYVWSYSGYSGYYSDYYGFWHDGEWIYNYGPKLVIRTSEKAALIDFTFNKDDYEPKYTVFDYCALADENYWLIKQGDNWGYCDHDGNVVKLFEGAGSFNNGIAPVVHDGQAFIVNESFEDLNNLGTATKVNTLGELIEVYNGKTVTCYVP